MLWNDLPPNRSAGLAGDQEDAGTITGLFHVPDAAAPEGSPDTTGDTEIHSGKKKSAAAKALIKGERQLFCLKESYLSWEL